LTEFGEPKGATGAENVEFELTLDRFDAVKLALASQELMEANLRPLAIEIALKVEQVGLEQRVIGVLVERRTPAQVDRARVDVTVRALVPRGIHPICR
jgi:hypothetical protein